MARRPFKHTFESEFRLNSLRTTTKTRTEEVNNKGEEDVTIEIQKTS